MASLENLDALSSQPMTQGNPNAGGNSDTPIASDTKVTVSPQDAKRWAEFRQRVETCKFYRKKLVRNWRVSIDMRRGKALASQSDEDQIPYNLDWSLTKTKQAALFSQVPKVRVDHSPESIDPNSPWVATFERMLNDSLVTAGVETAMDEVMPDLINAAGIGVVLVSRETLTVDKNLPQQDLSMLPPDIHKQVLQTGMLNGQPIPMTVVPQAVDARYTVRRISPADFLWPIDYTGSNFDFAPWVGNTGRLTWAEAKSRFKLKDADKPSVLGEEKTVEDRLSRDYERDHLADDGKVGYDQIFYREFQYDTDSPSFNAIHHLVFIHGKAEPVIDQAWDGQQIEQANGLPQIIGSQKYPLRTITLAYITDEDIPPSDSAVGRMFVNELNRGWTHIAKQRARTAPAIWFDVNRLDPAIQQALMRGIWQQAVPVQGDGSRIIGAIQQPPMGQENYEFDRLMQQSLENIWALSSDEEDTKDEQGAVTASANTVRGRERAKVASFFCGIAEVLGSLMCLYEDPSKFGQGFDPSFCTKLGYSVLADSTILLDANQRLLNLNNYMNTYAKTGWVNLQPVLREITQLIGLDPNVVVVAPQPQQPPMPNVSLRMTGAKDMMNPLMLAFMLKSGMGPTPDMIEMAKQLINDSVQMPQPQAPGTSQPPAPLPPTPGNALPQAGPLPNLTGGTSGQGPGGPQ